MKKKLLIGGVVLLSLLNLSPKVNFILNKNLIKSIKNPESLEYIIEENTNDISSSITLKENDKLDITSAIYLSANRYEDPITKQGVENSIKCKYRYENHKDSLPDAYSKSTAEVLVMGGHHYTGTTFVIDNKKQILSFYSLPKNKNIQFILFRGCHSIVNPDYLDEEAAKRHLGTTAADYLRVISNFAPNVRLIVGYETKSGFENDQGIIRLAANIPILEREGYKAYGEFAIQLGKDIYPIHGTEKNKDGDWNYDSQFHKRPLKEGTRIAYYIRTGRKIETENGIKIEKIWTYFSQDHPEGIDIKDLSAQK